MGIEAYAEFMIISTHSIIKLYTPGKLVFGNNMILPIKHNSDWELIHQQKKMQIN